MNIALITIGNELLAGFTVNTNASWIGTHVLKAGGKVLWHQTIGDSKEEIHQALTSIPPGCETIIITGGLGPTHDDVTAYALYDYAEDSPVFDEAYWDYMQKRLSKRNMTLPDLNRNQAMRPQKGNVIDNPVGSARGLHFIVDDKHIYAVPGVPREMKEMMKSTILPFIRQNSENMLFVRTIRTTGIMESALAEKLAHIVQDTPNGLTIAFLPQFTGVDVRLSSHDENRIKDLAEQIQSTVGKYIYGFDDDRLEDIVGGMLSGKSLTIATAESCTGGLIGHRITNVSGSSSYYVGGIVSYSNNVKESALNVDHEVLENHGAVSPETAIQMAENVREVLHADLGLSVTGIAGPTGGTKEKPVGLVYIALADGNNTIVKEFRFVKDRALNKNASSQTALNMVRSYINSQSK
jgi:nicotinamide-nucleotide amidase